MLNAVTILKLYRVFIYNLFNVPIKVGIIMKTLKVNNENEKGF